MATELDTETIAAQIHQFYLDQSTREGWKNDFSMPYPELPEFMKADNRAAARRIGEVLSLAGLRLTRGDGSPWAKVDQEEIRGLIEDQIDLLAEGEHQGWMDARLRQGWRYGPKKDIDLREHHLLIPWSDFPAQVKRKLGAAATSEDIDREVEQEKNKDRDSVRNYVRIIADTGYHITSETAPAEASSTPGPKANLT